MLCYPVKWVYAWAGMVVGLITCGELSSELGKVAKGVGLPKGPGRQAAARSKRWAELKSCLMGWAIGVWVFVLVVKIIGVIVETVKSL